MSLRKMLEDSAWKFAGIVLVEGTDDTTVKYIAPMRTGHLFAEQVTKAVGYTTRLHVEISDDLNVFTIAPSC